MDRTNPKDQLTVTSYLSSKGLGFDTVVLPRINKESFGYCTLDGILRLLLLGITRADMRLCLSTSGDGAFDPLNRLIATGAFGSPMM
jgi:superfamily I DNA/RNA helicase